MRSVLAVLAAVLAVLAVLALLAVLAAGPAAGLARRLRPTVRPAAEQQRPSAACPRRCATSTAPP